MEESHNKIENKITGLGWVLIICVTALVIMIGFMAERINSIESIIQEQQERQSLIDERRQKIHDDIEDVNRVDRLLKSMPTAEEMDREYQRLKNNQENPVATAERPCEQ